MSLTRAVEIKAEMTCSKKKTLIVLLGPTGVGKTDLSLRLAEHFHSPVLSADSRQIYKGMIIGTAAPTAELQKDVEHLFVGMLDIDHYFNAWQFEELVMETLDILFQQKETLLMCGGSMMYIDAVCNSIDYLPNVHNDIRLQLVREYEEKGLEPMQLRLKELDPDYYQIVDLKNHKRVLHALEICLTSGKTYTSFRTNKKAERPFSIIKIGLTREREELYQRINQRVDEMMDNGLLEEAKQLYPFRHHNALNTVGYKEIFKYLEGEWTLDLAIEKIKQNSRIYSRKQMTWFKRDPEIAWFHPDNQQEILQYIENQLNNNHSI